MTRAWTAPARGGVTWSARRGSVDIRITKASAVRLAGNITYNLSSFAVDERVWRIICQSHQQRCVSCDMIGQSREQRMFSARLLARLSHATWENISAQHITKSFLAIMSLA